MWVYFKFKVDNREIYNALPSKDCIIMIPNNSDIEDIKEYIIRLAYEIVADKLNYDIKVSDIKHRYRNSNENSDLIYVPDKKLWLDPVQYFNNYIFGYSVRNNKVIL